MHLENGIWRMLKIINMCLHVKHDELSIALYIPSKKCGNVAFLVTRLISLRTHIFYTICTYILHLF